MAFPIKLLRILNPSIIKRLKEKLGDQNISQEEREFIEQLINYNS